jgi:hypothetical protein
MRTPYFVKGEFNEQPSIYRLPLFEKEIVEDLG